MNLSTSVNPVAGGAYVARSRCWKLETGVVTGGQATSALESTKSFRMRRRPWLHPPANVSRYAANCVMSSEVKATRSRSSSARRWLIRLARLAPESCCFLCRPPDGHQRLEEALAFGACLETAQPTGKKNCGTAWKSGTDPTDIRTLGVRIESLYTAVRGRERLVSR